MCTREEGDSADHSFVLEQSSVMRVSPHNPTQRDIGLALGVLGPLILVGTFLIHLSTMDALSSDDADPREPKDLSTGESLAIGAGYLTGAAVTPIGWLMWAAGRKPDIEIEPFGGARR